RVEQRAVVGVARERDVLEHAQRLRAHGRAQRRAHGGGEDGRQLAEIAELVEPQQLGEEALRGGAGGGRVRQPLRGAAHAVGRRQGTARGGVQQRVVRRRRRQEVRESGRDLVA